MKATQRFLKALNHETVDRAPAASPLTAVTLDFMRLSGASWPSAHDDAGDMVRLAAAGWEHAGLESLKLPFDMTVEAGALGARVDMGSQTLLPQVKEAIYTAPDELPMATDITGRGRAPVVLRAIERARSLYGGEIPIIASIVGPFTLAARLFPMDDFLIRTLTEPEWVDEALLRVTDLCIRYAQALLDAGADAIQVGEASCSGDLISSDCYARFIAMRHRDLCAAISGPAIVHICGDITGHLEHIASTDMAGLSFDTRTDLTRAKALLGGKIALAGNVDTLAVLKGGTPGEVTQASHAALSGGIDILSAGCAWPPDVPLENARALCGAAKGYAGL